MTKMRMFLLQPDVVFAARVNMPGTITYPLDQVNYDTVTTGAYTSVWRGMTVLFGTAAGKDDLGRQRIRRTPTSTVLYIGRSSQGTRDGEVNLADNMFVTVIWDHRVWSKLAYIDPDGEIYKDSDIAANDSNQEALYPRPVAVGGPGFAGTIHPASGQITVNFDASDSWYWNLVPAGRMSSFNDGDVIWTVNDGTIISGANTDLAITVQFPAGFRYVYLTVTDSHGKSHFNSIPVYARDPDDDTSIRAFQIQSHRLAPDGQELSVRILQDIPRTTYPDGTLCMLWDDDLQSADIARTHMLFIGWHQTSEGQFTTSRTGTLRDTTMNFVDVAGRLKTLPGWSQRLENGSPTAWYYTTFPNVAYFFHHILYWHSTALEVAGGILRGSYWLSNLEYTVISADAGTLFDQVASIANRITPDQHLVCNQQGQLMLVVDPQIQPVADRTSAIMQDFDESDMVEFRFADTRPPRIYQMRTWAISGGVSSADKLLCLTPGHTPGQGTEYIETSERITFSQTDLNNAEGNRYARLNAPYGLFTFTVPYDLLDADFDIAYLAWVRLTIHTQYQPQRTLPGFGLVRGIVREMSVEYQYTKTGLVCMATLTWEMETSGPPGQTLVAEDEEPL